MWISSFFRVFPPETNFAPFRETLATANAVSLAGIDIWKNRELVKELTSRLNGVRLPEEVVPRCPDCGRVLVPGYEMIPSWREPSGRIVCTATIAFCDTG